MTFIAKEDDQRFVPRKRHITGDNVKVRRALPADKGPVLEFCKNTWPGGDYIPEVWDEWLSDRKGLLLVATITGKPVGCAHAYFQTKDVAWLEGVRVAPDYRGMGIAGRLNQALADYAAEKGARIARLCTGISNTASRRHLARTEFEVSQLFQRLNSKRALLRRPEGVARPVKDRQGLWKWLQETREFKESREAYSDGWTWYPLTRTSYQKLFKQQKVLLTSNNNHYTSLGIVSLDDRTLTLGFVAGDPVGVVKQARFLRFLLSKKKHDRARVLLPSKSSHREAFKSAGFEQSGKILLYEKLFS